MPLPNLISPDPAGRAVVDELYASDPRARPCEVLQVVICADSDTEAAALMTVVQESGAVEARRLDVVDVMQRIAACYERETGCPDLVVMSSSDSSVQFLSYVVGKQYPGVQIEVCALATGEVASQIARALHAIRTGEARPVLDATMSGRLTQQPAPPGVR